RRRRRRHARGADRGVRLPSRHLQPAGPPLHPRAARLDARGTREPDRRGGTMTSSVLSVNDLVVEYHGRKIVRAVDGIDLEISDGEVLAHVGESGCGKSTTARAIVGMERPQQGAIAFRGEPVPPLGLRRRPVEFTAMQMVFQNPNSSLNPRQRIGEQINDGARAAKVRGETSPAPAEWLSAVGLDPAMVDRYPHQFSGGQRQRIAIARALAARPDLLVADE